MTVKKELYVYEERKERIRKVNRVQETYRTWPSDHYMTYRNSRKRKEGRAFLKFPKCEEIYAYINTEAQLSQGRINSKTFASAYYNIKSHRPRILKTTRKKMGSHIRDSK